MTSASTAPGEGRVPLGRCGHVIATGRNVCRAGKEPRHRARTKNFKTEQRSSSSREGASNEGQKADGAQKLLPSGFREGLFRPESTALMALLYKEPRPNCRYWLNRRPAVRGSTDRMSWMRPPHQHTAQ